MIGNNSMLRLGNGEDRGRGERGNKSVPTGSELIYVVITLMNSGCGLLSLCTFLGFYFVPRIANRRF